MPLRQQWQARPRHRATRSLLLALAAVVHLAALLLASGARAGSGGFFENEDNVPVRFKSTAAPGPPPTPPTPPTPPRTPTPPPPPPPSVGPAAVVLGLGTVVVAIAVNTLVRGLTTSTKAGATVGPDSTAAAALAKALVSLEAWASTPTTEDVAELMAGVELSEEAARCPAEGHNTARRALALARAQMAVARRLDRVLNQLESAAETSPALGRGSPSPEAAFDQAQLERALKVVADTELCAAYRTTLTSIEDRRFRILSVARRGLEALTRAGGMQAGEAALQDLEAALAYAKEYECLHLPIVAELRDSIATLQVAIRERRLEAERRDTLFRLAQATEPRLQIDSSRTAHAPAMLDIGGAGGSGGAGGGHLSAATDCDSGASGYEAGTIEAIDEPGLDPEPSQRSAPTTATGPGGTVQVRQLAEWLVSASDSALSKQEAYRMAFTTAGKVHIMYCEQMAETEREERRLAMEEKKIQAANNRLAETHRASAELQRQGHIQQAEFQRRRFEHEQDLSIAEAVQRERRETQGLFLARASAAKEELRETMHGLVCLDVPVMCALLLVLLWTATPERQCAAPAQAEAQAQGALAALLFPVNTLKDTLRLALCETTVYFQSWAPHALGLGLLVTYAGVAQASPTAGLVVCGCLSVYCVLNQLIRIAPYTPALGCPLLASYLFLWLAGNRIDARLEAALVRLGEWQDRDGRGDDAVAVAPGTVPYHPSGALARFLRWEWRGQDVRPLVLGTALPAVSVVASLVAAYWVGSHVSP